MMQELLQLWFKSWRSIIEIILLCVGIYYGYLYFRGTRGAKVLTGLAIVFLTLTLISTLLNLVVIGWLLRSFSVFLAIALVVIFQPELRRGLAELGGHPIFSLTSEKRETVHDLAEAVTQLANKQFGALLAIERDTSIRVYEETGVTLNSDFSVELVLSIFHPKAALHDGGLIIRNSRIAAAACIFPVSQRETLGRGKALIGLAQKAREILFFPAACAVVAMKRPFAPIEFLGVNLSSAAAKRLVRHDRVQHLVVEHVF